MKKIFNITLIALALVLAGGVASAATTSSQPKKTTSGSAKYTAAQQTCIKTAQDTKSAAIKAATDTFNATTADALKTKQDAIKAATDTLNAATKAALATENGAIAAAVKDKDTKIRADAIRAATAAYNNNPAVKQAKIPYTAAVKAANDAYNNDETVKQAKVPYTAALKAANTQFQSSSKVCLKSSTGNSNFLQRIWHSLGGNLSGSFQGVLNFFSGK